MQIKHHYCIKHISPRNYSLHSVTTNLWLPLTLINTEHAAWFPAWSTAVYTTEVFWRTGSDGRNPSGFTVKLATRPELSDTMTSPNQAWLYSRTTKVGMGQPPSTGAVTSEMTSEQILKCFYTVTPIDWTLHSTPTPPPSFSHCALKPLHLLK